MTILIIALVFCEMKYYAFPVLKYYVFSWIGSCMEEKLKTRPLTLEEFQKLRDRDPANSNFIYIPITQQAWEQFKNDCVIAPIPLNVFPESTQKILNEIREWERYRDSLIEKLEYTPVKDIIPVWLSKYENPDTRRNYEYYITSLMQEKIIPEFDAGGKPYTVGHLLHVHRATLKYLAERPDWTEKTRKLRIACYRAFTNYLNKISIGWFPIIPARLDIHSPSTIKRGGAQGLTSDEWSVFLKNLELINARDALIAECMFYGAKISWVLNITLSQFDVENMTIRFNQNDRESLIKYPEKFVKKLAEYIEISAQQRNGSNLIFITRTGKKLARSRCNHSFAAASKNAGIKNVTPKVISITGANLLENKNLNNPDSLEEVMNL